MYWIIPKFKKIFADFGIELPAITDLADLHFATWWSNYWYLIPVIPIAFWLLIKIIRKNKMGEYMCDWILLRIPVLGKIVEKSTVARTRGPGHTDFFRRADPGGA